jgi:hypothetical protein
LRHGFTGLRDAASEHRLSLAEEDLTVLELIAARGKYIETGAMTVASLEALSRTAASAAETVEAAQPHPKAPGLSAD